MKREFLSELGLEKDVISKIMDANGEDINKAKADVDALKEQLADKDKAIAELNETIKGFEGTDETVKALQDKVAKYEADEKARKQAEKDAEADKILTDNIIEVIGDKEFVNDLTRQGIIAQVKSELTKSENKGKGAKDIFEAITKDADGIFKNPQHDNLEFPQGNTGAGSKDVDDAFVRQVMGLPPINN